MLIDKAMGHVGLDKGTSFVLYVLQHTNPRTKIFSRTYTQIQNDLGVSRVSISQFFKGLEEDGLLVRAGEGKWFVPAVIGKSQTCCGPEWYVEHK